MYAIVETGGKQHRVALGEKIRVERLKAEVGSDVQLDNVLLVSKPENILIGTPRVEDFEVRAKVTDHGRGDKIRVIKMKRRKNYRRTQGHRQDYTELQITQFGEEVLEMTPAVESVDDSDAGADDVQEHQAADTQPSEDIENERAAAQESS